VAVLRVPAALTVFQVTATVPLHHHRRRRLQTHPVLKKGVLMSWPPR